MTDEQYEFAKSQGRLWLRDVVQSLMESGGFMVAEPERNRTWWERLWK